MWVIKAHGDTYYVAHVDCNVPWSTKETPSNNHTKGSIKVKNCLLVIDEDNGATIKTLTLHDKFRLRNRQLGITRIAYRWMDRKIVRDALDQSKIKHGPTKLIELGCRSLYYVTDIYKKEDLVFLTLSASEKFRILMPNEELYKYYDLPNTHVDEEDYE